MKPTGVSRSSFLDADEPIAFRDIDEYLALTDGSVEPSPVGVRKVTIVSSGKWGTSENETEPPHGMNAEPPIARLLLDHQSWRPDDV